MKGKNVTGRNDNTGVPPRRPPSPHGLKGAPIRSVALLGKPASFPPDLPAPSPGPSHLTSTIALPPPPEASGSEKLTKEREDTSAGRRTTTDHLPTPSNGHLLIFSLWTDSYILAPQAPYNVAWENLNQMLVKEKMTSALQLISV